MYYFIVIASARLGIETSLSLGYLVCCNSSSLLLTFWWYFGPLFLRLSAGMCVVCGSTRLSLVVLDDNYEKACIGRLAQLVRASY